MGKIALIIFLAAIIGIIATFPFLLWFLLLFIGIVLLDVAAKKR
jgi:hypothetical protein